MEFSKNLTFAKLIDKINNKQPFSFVRYGDGEWNAIFQKNGNNCDGHEYFSDMGTALANIVKSNPNYYLGMQSLAMNTQGDRINKFIDDYYISIEWVDADILHHANIAGKFDILFKALNNSFVIMVSPAHLKGMKDYFSYDYFIEIPDKNCWTTKDKTIAQTANAIDKLETPVVLFTASMAANYYIDILYYMYGKSIIMIDAGSIFEPYIGKQTRSYHSKLTLDFDSFKS